MLSQYRQVITANYQQAAISVGSRIDNMLSAYNTITKMPYYYNFSGNGASASYLTFDRFRQIVYGIGYDPETMEKERKNDMEIFLRNLMSTDTYICLLYPSIIFLNSRRIWESRQNQLSCRLPNTFPDLWTVIPYSFPTKKYSLMKCFNASFHSWHHANHQRVFEHTAFTRS